tara:strand:- start:81 stop:695 length:615 start_codon:yes stop_codon:yes gene_type:complete
MEGLVHKIFNFIAQEENKPLYDAIEKIKRGTKKFEPSLLAPYNDPSGNPTYAYGIETNRYGKKNSISEMEMQFTKIIKEDVLKTIENINVNNDLKLNDNQKTALASLLYNVGETQFKYKKDKETGRITDEETEAFSALKRGDLETFKKEAFGERGFISGGLLTERRKRELELFEKPIEEMQIKLKDKPLKPLPQPSIGVSFPKQ